MNHDDENGDERRHLPRTGRRAADSALFETAHDTTLLREELQSLKTAMFGHPDLREDGGIVKDIADVRRGIQRVTYLLTSLLVTVIAAAVSILLTVVAHAPK